MVPQLGFNLPKHVAPAPMCENQHAFTCCQRYAGFLLHAARCRTRSRNSRCRSVRPTPAPRSLECVRPPTGSLPELKDFIRRLPALIREASDSAMCAAMATTTPRTLEAGWSIAATPSPERPSRQHLTWQPPSGATKRGAPLGRFARLRPPDTHRLRNKPLLRRSLPTSSSNAKRISGSAEGGPARRA